MRWLSLLVLIAPLGCYANLAHAQLDPEIASLDESDEASDDAPLAAEGELAEANEDAAEEGEALEDDGDAEARKLRLDPHEEPGKKYFFAGWMLRGMIVPKFLLEAFLGSSPRVADWSTGAELTYRKDNFDIIVGAWWSGYRFAGPVRDKSDPIEDTEWLDSNWSGLITSVSFLWGTEFTDQWALQYGLDVGLIWLVGKLYRSEAYRDADGNYHPCERAGMPDDRAPSGIPYCEPVTENAIPGSDPYTTQDDKEGAHYHVKQRRWTEGGNAPTFVPWLALRLALRYKPIKQVMTRAEVGFGLGMYLGLSAAYGF